MLHLHRYTLRINFHFSRAEEGGRERGEGEHQHMGARARSPWPHLPRAPRPLSITNGRTGDRMVMKTGLKKLEVLMNIAPIHQRIYLGKSSATVIICSHDFFYVTANNFLAFFTVFAVTGKKVTTADCRLLVLPVM